jgi:hypothetical protein
LRVTLYTTVVRWSTAPGTVVRVVLADAARVKRETTVSADPAGEVVAIFPTGGGGPGGGNDNTVRPGDRIGVHPTGSAAFTVTVAALSASFNPTGSEVSGTGPAGTQLDLTTRDASDAQLHSATVTTGGDGRYSQGVGVAAVPGLHGDVTMTTPDGDRITARWDVLTAELTLGSATVRGSATLGGVVRGVLRNAGGVRGQFQPLTVLRTPTYGATYRQNQNAQPVEAGGRHLHRLAQRDHRPRRNGSRADDDIRSGDGRHVRHGAGRCVDHGARCTRWRWIRHPPGDGGRGWQLDRRLHGP